MRILFMGTPDIAADCLKALYVRATTSAGSTPGAISPWAASRCSPHPR